MLFAYQFKPPLKTELKGTKWYDKSHNAQDGIKILELIRSVVCSVGVHLKGTWDMMKADKHIYI